MVLEWRRPSGTPRPLVVAARSLFLAEGFPRAPSPCFLHSVDHLAVWGKSTWETHGGRLRVGPAMGAVLALACPRSQRPGSLAVFSTRWVGSTSRGLRVVTREPPEPRHVGWEPRGVHVAADSPSKLNVRVRMPGLEVSHGDFVWRLESGVRARRGRVLERGRRRAVTSPRRRPHGPSCPRLGWW